LAIPTTNGVQVNALADFESTYGANLIGATVARVRGAISMVPTVAGASQAIFAARVSLDSDATAGNGPYDAQYADWSMYEPFVYNDAGVADAEQATVRVVDVKSMRKLDEVNEQFTWWIQARGQAYQATWNLSVLLLLP
jgi:hypothetical protein